MRTSNRRSSFALVALYGVLSGCSAGSGNDVGANDGQAVTEPGGAKHMPNAYAADVEKRIERIVGGLLAETAFRNNYDDSATLTERMSHYKTPGVSIAVVNNYEIEWARGFGVREWGKSDPVTATTVFQAGSISKPVFAVGVMRLVQEGILDLDQDVNAYLESWKIPANGDWRPRVTLRQILSHSAGLNVHGFPGYQRVEEVPSVVDILRGKPPANTSAVRVNMVPGISFRYSGGGTTVAQQLVVDVVGKSFPETMDDLVFGPLGLEHSSYAQPMSDDHLKHAATAHPWKYEAVTGNWHVYPEMAAAGLWTTPTDLAQLGIEIQLAAKGESEFLSKEIVDGMLTPQTNDINGMGYFMKGNTESDSVRFTHGGWDEGFVANFVMHKNSGMGAVIMINSNEGASIILEIERAIAREYSWPDYLEENAPALQLSQRDLDVVSGSYQSDSGFEFIITHDGTTLSMVAGTQDALELHPKSSTEFFAKALNVDVTFDEGEGGKITGLTLIQGGSETTATKQISE